MTIVVVMEQVPDVVEELAIAPSGTDLDRDAVSYVVNEYDDHALEEALLLAEATGDEVVAVGIDTTGELDQALYTALAKGARRAIKLTGDFEGTWLSTRAAARLLVPVIQELEPRLVLTGVQAPDDLDGQLAPTLAALLGWPHASVVIGSQLVDGALQVRKELWGGMTMTLELELPAVLGVQAARQAGMPEEACRHFETLEELLHHLPGWLRPGDTVLVKGSRGMGMERVVRALEEGAAWESAGGRPQASAAEA